MAGTGVAYPADAVAGSPQFTANQGRNAFSGAMAGATASRPLGGISGVRPGTPANTITATSTTWTMNPNGFAGYIDLETSATNSGYFFSFSGTITGAVTAAGGSPRTDIVWVKIDDSNTSDGSSGAPRVELDYSANTTTPPARAFVIAQINVPASGGGSPTVTWVAPYTVAAGGILPIASTAITASTYPGQYIDDPTQGLMRSNGTTWVRVSGASSGIVPTSVAGSGVSLGPGGAVTLATASTASINGCFTSAYDNYLIEFDFTTSSASGTLNVTLRVGGTDATTAYDTQRVTFINATVAATQSLNAANWVGSGGLATAGGRQFGEMVLYKPALAVATGGTIKNNLVANPMTTSDGRFEGTLQHRTATAYDGITFTAGGGTFTGTIRIYGLNNN